MALSESTIDPIRFLMNVSKIFDICNRDGTIDKDGYTRARDGLQLLCEMAYKYQLQLQHKNLPHFPNSLPNNNDVKKLFENQYHEFADYKDDCGESIKKPIYISYDTIQLIYEDIVDHIKSGRIKID